MKIALILSIVCAATVFSGCCTGEGGTGGEGGTADQQELYFGTTESTATLEQIGPTVLDPSLPKDPAL